MEKKILNFREKHLLGFKYMSINNQIHLLF